MNSTSLNKNLKEKDILLAKVKELETLIADEKKSHGLSKEQAEDLQIRIDEEIISYGHAKSFIEDLQNRLEDEINQLSARNEQIQDLRVRIDEELNQSIIIDSSVNLQQNYEDMHKRLDEEMVSSAYLRTYAEDLQLRVDEELLNQVHHRATIEDLNQRLDEELQARSQTKQRIEELEIILRNKRNMSKSTSATKQAASTEIATPSIIGSATNTLLFFPTKEFSSRYGEQFFTAQVESYDITQNESWSWYSICLPNSHIVYDIKVQSGKKEWRVVRRYSEFHKLFNLSNNTVDFPPKTFFPNFESSFLKKRMDGLNLALTTYLQRESKNGTVVKNKQIIEFLRL